MEEHGQAQDIEFEKHKFEDGTDGTCKCIKKIEIQKKGLKLL